MAFKKDVLQIENNVNKMLSQTQASIIQNVSPAIAAKQKPRTSATGTPAIASNISPIKPLNNLLNQSMTQGFMDYQDFEMKWRDHQELKII